MKQALILFTRVPQPGKTKTRLLGLLTAEACADAHAAFLQDQAEACRDPARWELLIFYGGEGPVPVLRQLLPEQDRFFPQEGSGIGEKMDRAIRRTLAMGYERCVLVGTDLPELSRERIGEAFSMLRRKDIVLGPTPDGGYYLIGTGKPCPELFEGQRYGGSTVLESTEAAARMAGLQTGRLPELCDVDEPEDLRALADRLAGQPVEICPHTRTFLRRLSEGKGTL